MEIRRIIEIAKELGLEKASKELQRIEQIETMTDCPIVLPLVGEFSSGKTTLINALTDKCKLKTDPKPTTATVFEVHFGCDRCHALVVSSQGEETAVDDISTLNNELYADAAVVNVYDTSTRVPSSVVLVDTPGISSQDIKHKQTLVNFLPHADAILLVSDINQQITKSLIDFVDTIRLSKRPVYIVLTQCDTKSGTDIETAKAKTFDNAELPIQQIACVSSKKGDLDELYSMLQNIQQEKNDIIKRVNEERVKSICQQMAQQIDVLIQSVSSDEDYENTIREQQIKLKHLNRCIDALFEGIKEDVDCCQKECVRAYEDTIFGKLDSLVAEKGCDFDSMAMSAVNNTASLMLDEFKSNVTSAVAKHIRSKHNDDQSLDFTALKDLDLSSFSIGQMRYGLNLNELGHKYDGVIAAGIKAAAVAAAAWAGASAGMAVAADGADTVSDIPYDGDNVGTRFLGNHAGNDEGLVQSLVGLVTERTMGKPQRRKAIHTYLDDELIPLYKTEVSNVTKKILIDIETTLHEEAAKSIDEVKAALAEYKQKQCEQKTSISEQKQRLSSYKNELLSI